jgi:hypothetical protein
MIALRNFARAVKRIEPKSIPPVEQVIPMDKLKLQEEIKTIEMMHTVKDCLQLTVHAAQMHRQARALLLVRLSRLR